MKTKTTSNKTQNKLKHSKLGITSFIVSLFALLVNFFIGTIRDIRGWGLDIPTPPTPPISTTSSVTEKINMLDSIINICSPIGLAICILAIILGVNGLLQKNRKKLFV